MKILVLDRYPKESLSPLTQKGFQLTENPSPLITSDTLLGYDALLIRSRTRITAELLKKVNQLKVIVTATSGFDHIDLEACQAKNIAVFYTPEANAQSAAEHTLFLILSCLRNATQVAKLNEQKLWKDQLLAGQELHGKQLGLIGFGRVGRKVARLAQAFGAHVKFFDPYVGYEVAAETDTLKTDITELLKTSDIISLHVPLTRETKNIMHDNNIAELSSEAILINTSRGEAVCETSLINALSEGNLASAGLDVFMHEPLSEDSKLRSLKNVVITPHIGALTTQALQKASRQAVEKLLHFLTTGATDDALPKHVPWYKPN